MLIFNVAYTKLLLLLSHLLTHKLTRPPSSSKIKHIYKITSSRSAHTMVDPAQGDSVEVAQPPAANIPNSASSIEISAATNKFWSQLWKKKGQKPSSAAKAAKAAEDAAAAAADAAQSAQMASKAADKAAKAAKAAAAAAQAEEASRAARAAAMAEQAAKAAAVAAQAAQAEEAAKAAAAQAAAVVAAEAQEVAKQAAAAVAADTQDTGSKQQVGATTKGASEALSADANKQSAQTDTKEVADNCNLPKKSKKEAKKGNNKARNNQQS